MERAMEIAERIKAWRTSLGLTQDEFARRSGLSKATLVGYEVGQRKPGADALAAIAKTGCNMTWLLTGDGDMRAQTSMEPCVPATKNMRRWEKIMALVEGIEDEEQRAKALDELFSRAQSAAELAELRQAVRQLQKASPKAA